MQVPQSEVNILDTMIEQLKLHSKITGIIQERLRKKLDVEIRDVYASGLPDVVYVNLKVSLVKKKRKKTTVR